MHGSNKHLIFSQQFRLFKTLYFNSVKTLGLYHFLCICLFKCKKTQKWTPCMNAAWRDAALCVRMQKTALKYRMYYSFKNSCTWRCKIILMLRLARLKKTMQVKNKTLSWRGDIFKKWRGHVPLMPWELHHCIIIYHQQSVSVFVNDYSEFMLSTLRG